MRGKVGSIIIGLLEGALKIALNKRAPMGVQRLALSIVEGWSSAVLGIRYGVAADLQPYLSEISGYPLCGYCQWVVWPGEIHEHCQHVLKGEIQCPFCNGWVLEGSAYCDYCDGCLDPTQSIFLRFEDETIAREEAAAWEEYRREREESIDPYGPCHHG